MKSSNLKVYAKVPSLVGAILMIANLSACGSRSAATSGTNSSGSTSGSTTIPSTNPTGNIYGLAPAPQSMFQITGDTGTARSWSPGTAFSSETKLKVKISPLPATNITVPGYNNWVFLTAVCLYK